MSEKAHRAYLAGVYSSDGYLTKTMFGLNVKDLDFAEAFKKSIESISQYIPKIHLNKDNTYVVRVSNKKKVFEFVKNFNAYSVLEKAYWLKGFFDGDGNANLTKSKRYENSYYRRIAFYNTELELIKKINDYLYDLNIIATFQVMKLSDSHYGNKPVYELKLISGRQNYYTFRALISSSIKRKRDTINSIVETYNNDNLSNRMKANQKKSAEIRRLNFLTIGMQTIILEMIQLAKSNKLTQQFCCKNIDGYYNALNYFTHKQLIKMMNDGKSNN